jgi:hypothetical protein
MKMIRYFDIYICKRIKLTYCLIFGYAVLDLNSYNLWREHQNLSCNSSFKDGGKGISLKQFCMSTMTLTIASLTDDNTLSKNETNLYRYLKGMIVGAFLPPFQGVPKMVSCL